MEQEILAKLKELIKPYIEFDDDLDKMGLDTNLVEGMNFDSADLVEIILDIEEHYEIEVEDEEIENIRTAGDVVNLIKDKIA